MVLVPLFGYSFVLLFSGVLFAVFFRMKKEEKMKKITLLRGFCLTLIYHSFQNVSILFS